MSYLQILSGNWFIFFKFVVSTSYSAKYYFFPLVSLERCFTFRIPDEKPDFQLNSQKGHKQSYLPLEDIEIFMYPDWKRNTEDFFGLPFFLF